MSPLARGSKEKRRGMFTKCAKVECEFIEEGGPNVEHSMNAKAIKCFQNLWFDRKSEIWSSSTSSSIDICRIWPICIHGDKWAFSEGRYCRNNILLNFCFLSTKEWLWSCKMNILRQKFLHRLGRLLFHSELVFSTMIKIPIKSSDLKQSNVRLCPELRAFQRGFACFPCGLVGNSKYRFRFIFLFLGEMLQDAQMTGLTLLPRLQNFCPYPE